MKRTIAAIVAIFGLYWITVPGWTIGEPDLPYGVTLEEWVAISDDVGLVIGLTQSIVWPGEGPKPHPRAESVLMAKVHGQWTIIEWPKDTEKFEFRPVEPR